MKITKTLQIVTLGALSLGIASMCSAQSDAPYTEGPVWNITMVKTKSGMTDEYLKGLAKTLKGTLEEAKKQNLVLDYKILLGNAASAQDFDILILVESKNMAALDNGREKFDREKSRGHNRSTAGDGSQTPRYSGDNRHQADARNHAEVILRACFIRFSAGGATTAPNIVGVGAASQLWIPRGERSGLLTRIATTEIVS